MSLLPCKLFRTRIGTSAITLVGVLCLITLGGCNNQSEPASKSQALPSWQDNAKSERLYRYVIEVSTQGHQNFLPKAERIAVFDNDGTLWAEQPAYFQLFFAIDRIRQLSGSDENLKQQWQSSSALQAAMNNDLAALAKTGEAGILEVVMTSHSGLDVATSAEFQTAVSQWIKDARHPTTQKRFTEMVYQPMLELLDFLKSRDFKVYIVSGGGLDFMRPWASEVYGIPREQIIGSSVKLTYEYRDGEPVLLREPVFDHFNDKAGKPEAIHKFIGKKPVLAFGNSDGDLQMLQWTHANSLPNLSGYIHHTDSEREWAYDKDSHIGRLKQGLKQAQQDNWLVIDMKQDWTRIYPDQSK